VFYNVVSYYVCCAAAVLEEQLISVNLCVYIANNLFGVTISPEKLFYRERKSIALYSSANTLCGIYG